MGEFGQHEWEQAFTAYALDAATGRLFRGLAHNINGAAQTFSMQTELLQMFFGQAHDLLTQMENASSLDEVREISRKLHVLMERRAALVVYLEREVKVIREIMKRCSGLVAVSSSQAAGGPFSLQAAVETELEFMNGDPFFKHKVKWEVEFAAEMPAFPGFQVEIHQILLVLIENASQSLQATFVYGQTFPWVRIAAVTSGDQLSLTVCDNGEGIAPELQGRIFEPFFSTRPGRLGMGLWLAGKLVERIGGGIRCESEPGRTIFTLSLPGTGGGDVCR